MDTLVIILLPTSFGVVIILSVIIWLLDRHHPTLTERRKTAMFKFLKKKEKTDELQELLDDFKKFIPRHCWQEIDDIKAANDLDRVKRLLNRLCSLHPLGKEASDKIVVYLSQHS